jgi:hypothetical protein
VLLWKKCLILRHGHKKTRQEKGEEEEQKVTFALPPLSLLTNTGPQGRCFFSGDFHSEIGIFPRINTDESTLIPGHRAAAGGLLGTH